MATSTSAKEGEPEPQQSESTPEKTTVDDESIDVEQKLQQTVLQLNILLEPLKEVRYPAQCPMFYTDTIYDKLKWSEDAGNRHFATRIGISGRGRGGRQPYYKQKPQPKLTIMTKVNNIAKTLYPGVKDLHEVEMRLNALVKRYERVTEFRDRQWVIMPGSSDAEPSETVLGYWSRQLKQYLGKHAESETKLAQLGIPADLEEVCQSDLMCVALDHWEEGGFVENLAIHTRKDGQNLRVVISLQDGEINARLTKADSPRVSLLERTEELKQELTEWVRNCFKYRISVAMLIRDGVWSTIEKLNLRDDPFYSS